MTLTRGHRWPSVPEWVVHRLGGDLVREPSLASRTGLIDQATGSVWTRASRRPASRRASSPRRRLAGTAAGTLRSAHLPPSLRGAALTVAGHDHPVAAVGVGAVGPDELFNSSGTADVLARSLPGVLSGRRAPAPGPGRTVRGRARAPRDHAAARRRPRRAAAAAGPRRPRRGRLARARAARPGRPRGRRPAPGPRGLRRRTHGDDVVLRLRDDVTPAHVWAAATRYTAAETGALIATIESIVGPHRRAVASGGWTRMESVRAAKRRGHSTT